MHSIRQARGPLCRPRRVRTPQSAVAHEGSNTGLATGSKRVFVQGLSHFVRTWKHAFQLELARGAHDGSKGLG